MTNLCGHDQDVLIWAIEYARDMWRDDATVLHNLQSVEWRPKNPSRFDAMSAIIDPAKLAEMLAVRGRELGLNINVEAHENGVMIRIEDGLPLPPLRFRTMASARAILLQWLQLPDGAREQAEKALRGET